MSDQLQQLSAFQKGVVTSSAAFNDLTSQKVLAKYELASKIANAVLKEVVENTLDGRSIYELSAFADRLITEWTNQEIPDPEVEKGIAFPTCIGVNEVCLHDSPLEEDTRVLRLGDIVNIDLGVHVDGYIATVGQVVILNPIPQQPIKGKVADAVCGAYYAMEAASNLFKVGVKSSDITKAIDMIATSFHCKPVIGVYSSSMRRFILNDKKAIPNTFSQDQEAEPCTIEYNDVYSVDITMSTGEGKLRECERKPTIFQRNVHKKYNLKLKTSKAFFNEVIEHHPVFPFSIRSIEDKRTRLGTLECVNHDLVHSFPILSERRGEVVVRFKATFLITAEGTLRITQPTVIPYVHSEYTIDQQPELKKLIDGDLSVVQEKSMEDMEF